MRKRIAATLRWQAKRYIKKHKPTIVVVSGSVGKTSTTQAIATILSQPFQVRSTIKNYNSDIGVPCSIFGRHIPEYLHNPFAWVWLLIRNSLNSLKKPSFSVLVLELGTDRPGELAEFAWLQPDIAVVTAIADEHMEFFKALDNVAREELSIASYSDKTIINKHMVPQEFRHYAETEELYNYSREDIEQVGLMATDLKVIGEHSIDAVSAGLAVGKSLGMSDEDLRKGAVLVTPQRGRMYPHEGMKSSLLIDDTYNASPAATTAALDYLYSVESTQRIALLGNMNELGESSKESHRAVGNYCDPSKLDLVVTLGDDANSYLAEMAKKRGCRVIETQSPYESASKIKENMQEGAVILLKGSQNGVFAEEAVKLLLANPEDEKNLVRQNKFWLKKKREQFKGA